MDSRLTTVRWPAMSNKWRSKSTVHNKAESLTIIRKFVIAALSIALLLLASATLIGCLEEPIVADNPVQAFVDENHEALDASAQDHLEALGEGSTVEFIVGTNELIYVYTFGPEYTADQLEEYVHAFLTYMPANDVMYESLAAELAQLMDIDSLILTIRYYDSDSEYIASKSFESP